MIGIFDSGVGGMTVARAIEQLMPHYPLIYLGDIARSPYGPKSGATIAEYASENTRFLIDNGATLIVIACNSAASVATGRLQDEYDLPIFEVISPAVKEAIRQSRTGKFGIIGTKATIESNVYKELIEKEVDKARVISKACPLLVPLVEENWLDTRETKMILRKYLHSFSAHQIDTLVLGCTHYPLLAGLIQHRIGKRVSLIDSSQATARFLLKSVQKSGVIEPDNAHTPAANKYYVTDHTSTAQRVAETIFKRPIELLHA